MIMPSGINVIMDGRALRRSPRPRPRSEHASRLDHALRIEVDGEAEDGRFSTRCVQKRSDADAPFVLVKRAYVNHLTEKDSILL